MPSELVEAHLPCEDCGSSDALAVYSDGHAYCFSCRTKRSGGGGEANGGRKVPEGLLAPGDFVDLIARRISSETCRKFGYSVSSLGGRAVQIAPYYDKDGALVAQKLRFPDKTFAVKGDIKKGGLFGQRLWAGRDAGTSREQVRRLVITEGEVDALSYAEATGCRWPVVSIPNGAQDARKAIARSLEFVESWDKVILLFDQDEPGRAAAAECAEVLTPGKAFIASLPLKDASDMLKAGRVKELSEAVWNARPYRPDGIVNGMDLWDTISAPTLAGVPYPFEGLNRVLFGRRPSEIVTVVAGSGIGKSLFVREIAYDAAMARGETIAYIALEESVKRSALGFLSIKLDKPLHLPGHGVSPEEMKQAFDATLGTGRFILYDHFGSLGTDNLLARMRYVVKALGCKLIVLDHLSIVVSGMDLGSDERRMLDNTMTRLRSFAEETEVSLIVVSHLKRPEGKGHEDGAVTSLAQLRGSHAIAQLSDIVIGLERNQQDDNETDRDTLTVRVLKNRFAGITGIAGNLRYDRDTGRLVETDSPSGDFNDDSPF